MTPHLFNPNRLCQLEELLDIEYEKLYEIERALALADGITQRVYLKQQIKRDLIPRLRVLEGEYAELLANGVSIDEIPESEAEAIVSQVVQSVANMDQEKPQSAPHEMVRLLTEIKDKLNEPGKSASAKLKVTLPLIPLISSYEMELDTEAFVTQAWRKARDLFKRLINRPK
jgi:hydrogenase maturation factor